MPHVSIPLVNGRTSETCPHNSSRYYRCRETGASIYHVRACVNETKEKLLSQLCTVCIEVEVCPKASCNRQVSLSRANIVRSG